MKQEDKDLLLQIPKKLDDTVRLKVKLLLNIQLETEK